mgnify:CR=1 FL=1|jgi:hypothetical protein
MKKKTNVDVKKMAGKVATAKTASGMKVAAMKPRKK